MAENLSAGVRVRLHSLQAAAQHNGVDGHLLKWNASTGRWGVKLSTGQELSVRPANVMPTCSHAGCGQRIGASEAAGAGLRTCAKCRQVRYCSRACQKAAWRGGHKEECEELQLERWLQVCMKIHELHSSNKHRDVANMAEEGLAVAGELRGARPELAPNIEVAANIYRMLGCSFCNLCEHVKGLGLLEQARALAVEVGDRRVLGRVCTNLGHSHAFKGEHAKAIAEYEQSLAIVVELGNRQGESVACSNLGMCFSSLKEYDKAIELFEQSLAIYEELGDRSGQAKTHVNLGVCLSRHGQHDRAVACIKKAWAVFQQLGDADLQAPTAKDLGEALWAQARAEHHQAAPDATSCGGICAAGSETLQEAETWLRTALDLAVKRGAVSVRMHAQMHLACVAMSKGNEDEAVELLSQHLQGWLDSIGPHRCAGCGQVRGEDAPMLSCDGCRVARYCNAACQKRAWKGEIEGLCYGMSHKGICPLLRQWRKVAKGKATVESAGLREAMVEYLRAAVSVEPGAQRVERSSAELTAVEVHTVMVECLRANVDDLRATLAACESLALLTEDEQPEKTAAIAKAGAIEAVLEAGAKHAGSAKMAKQVCRVLGSLAYHSDDNRAAVAVVRVMGEHHATAAVMEAACGALTNLAKLDDDQALARIAAAEGIEAVVRVLGEHQANAAVMEAACGALFNIGWSDEALQKRIKDAGAEPLVRAAVAAPDATDDTKEEGQMLLAKLMDAKDIAELVEGLRANVDDLPAALAACQTLACLLQGEVPDKAAAVVKAGGIEAVLAAGAKHCGSAQVAEQVCSVLRILAYHGDENEAAVAAAGGIEAVVRALGEHQANAAVMEEACGALFNIGWSDQALQKRIKDAGAEPLVRAAVAAPDASEDTKEEGQELLDRLDKLERIPKALQTEKENFAAQRASGDIVVERLQGCPADVTHDVAAKTLQFDDFATAGAPAALTTSGVLYFEITVLESSDWEDDPEGSDSEDSENELFTEGSDSEEALLQIGFSLKDGIERGDMLLSDGCGDKPSSWALDGVRCRKWFEGAESEWPCTWVPGDVIGFAANVDAGKVAVSKNGKWTEEGCGIVLEDDKIKQGVFPCLTGGSYNIRYAFKDFSHAPPDDDWWS